jgi:hypothetical protein
VIAIVQKVASSVVAIAIDAVVVPETWGNLGTDGTYPDYFFLIWESQRQAYAIVVCGVGHLC